MVWAPRRHDRVVGVLLNDILDFSKIEAGKLDVDAVDFSLRTMLEDALKPVALRVQQKGLELLVDVAPGVPDALVGDAHRPRQVVVNLVGNAVKFTQRGEILVRVETVPARDHHVGLHISVIDTGIGIPQEKLATIFQPFTQADGSTTRRFGGTGLGLTISAKLVELMGGHLWVESEVGRGSAFHFSVELPISATPVVAAFLPRRDELIGMRALVVDDNATNRRILTEILSSWGMPVVAVDTRDAAVAAAREASDAFRVLLIDDQLGDGSRGQDVALALRTDPRHAATPVLILSSADRPRTDVDAAAVIAGHLVKPVSQAGLLMAIRTAIGHRTHDHGQGAAPSVTPARAARELRVLVVEDNPVNRRIAQGLLERRGHTVSLANDGREAVAAVAGGAFDLILMDLQMPEMNGFDATAAIRTAERGTGRRVPIVAFTAEAMQGDRERCLAADMDGYVSKPIRPVEFFEVIDRVMYAVLPSPSVPLRTTEVLPG